MSSRIRPALLALLGCLALASSAALAMLPRAAHQLGGGGNQVRGSYGDDPASAPDPYGKDKRLPGLSTDPAHGDQITDPSIREGMAGLRAEKVYGISGLVRGPAQIEFYDKDGTPYDVKTPPSPEKGAKWVFNAKKAGDAILKQLRARFKNALTDEPEDVLVILDSTYMNDVDHASLWHYLHQNKGNANLDHIYEVHTH